MKKVRFACWRGRDKIKNFTDILKIVRNAQKRGLRVVTTNGVFDLLHVGHIRNLEKAKSLGDLLLVGVNSDKSVKLFKSKDRPIVPQRNRAEVVAALSCVDYVFIFGGRDPRRWLSKIKNNIHVKGQDRKISEIVEKEVVENNGGKIVLLPIIKNKSTTKLINAVLEKHS